MTVPSQRPRGLAWAVLALVGLALGWWAWSHRRPPAAGPSAGVSAAAPTPTARETKSPAALSLRVNFAHRAEILPSTPLLFEVELTGLTQAPGISAGDRDHPWSESIRLVRRGSNENVPWVVAPLGAPYAVAMPATGTDPLAIRVEPAGTAIVARGRVNHVSLGVAPDATASVPPGTYEIEARLDAPAAVNGGRLRASSAPVTIVVLGDVRDASTEKHEYERLKLSALYYLAARQAEQAQRSAQALVERYPKSADAAMILGDAFSRLGDRDQAMRAYRSALALSPKAYEAPDLIYDRIAALSRGTGSR